ncbi:hypothetical protein [Paenibacillus agricola]|uniref:Uncharacterized protein n=1 Tax=Paenibacillus agricola TaxID=2716264 RepID=A0ABX0JBR9_9BACL|nr:hypothetical protein [Paenibacillus agricola]NHN33398.1 hypothetical protein [Paenibacillus agricola]
MKGSSANALEVLVTYFGIMSVFVMGTYYFEKMWNRRKRASKVKANA